MEHFLPLAIASLVISLISIILLDYFGPTTSAASEQDALSATDAFENTEDHQVISEETNKEIALEQDLPIRSNEFIQSFKNKKLVVRYKLLNKYLTLQRAIF